MVSRRIQILTERIEGATDVVLAGCLRAERASVYARLGQYELASAEIVATRSLLSKRITASLSTWLNLSGGINEFFAGKRRLARDLIERAAALSMISEDSELRSLCHAWRAHLDSDFDDLPRMIESLALSIRFFDGVSDIAGSRLRVALAHAYSHAGDLGRAFELFRLARSHASRIGDDVMQSALIGNMASLSADHARIDELFSPGRALSARQLWLANESAINIDEALGATGFSWAAQMMRAEVLVRESHFSAAYDTYKGTFKLLNDSEDSRREALVRADMAWCLLNMGRIEESTLEARAAESTLHLILHQDDMAVALGRLHRVFSRLGIEDTAHIYLRRAQVSWNKLLDERSWLLKELELLQTSSR